MDTTKLTARAKKALEVLVSGGEFVSRLERNNYTGRDKYACRLTRNGHVISGFGPAVFNELRDMLVMSNSTSVSTYYKLRTAV